MVDGEPVRPRRRRRRPTPHGDRRRRRVVPSARRCRPEPAEAYRGDIERAVADIARLARATATGSSSSTPATARPSGWSRCSREHDVAARLVEDARPTATSPTGVVTVTCGALDARLRRRDQPARACSPATTCPGSRPPPATCAGCRRAARSRSTRSSSSAGDYVVHEQHGVGRFVEMKQREVGGATREYLVLEYGASKRGGPPDRLYVPADALDQVTRYVGGEQPSPRPARRRRLGQAQGPGPQGGPRDRGRADQAVRRPAGHQGPRLRARHARGSASSRTPSRSTRPPTS